MNYRYLPEKKNHLYAYNAAVDTRMKYAKKLSEIIPNNGNPKDYNKQITTSLIEVKLCFLKLCILLTSSFLDFRIEAIS